MSLAGHIFCLRGPQFADHWSKIRVSNVFSLQESFNKKFGCMIKLNFTV